MPKKVGAVLMDALAEINKDSYVGRASQKGENDEQIERLAGQCVENMDDDFNTAKTIACLFEMATIVNSIKGQQIDLNSIHPDSILLLEKPCRIFSSMYLVYNHPNNKTTTK